MLRKTFGITLTLVLLISATSNAQGRMGFVGKIFDKKEAKTLFGEVKKSFELKPNILKKALLQAKDYVLIVVKNGRISIANEKKQVLAGEVQAISGIETTSYAFSKDKVAEFISLIGSSSIAVEERASTTTLTAADYTLEFALPCPPVCFE